MADTLSTIKVSGGDYADPQLWENDTDVSTGRWIGEIQDNSEYLNTNLTFFGGTGTPDADNFSWLRVASANKHLGVSGSGHARMRDTAGHVIDIEARAFTVIEGLEIVLDSAGSSDEGIRVESEDTLVSRCIVRATSSITDQDGIHVPSGGVTNLYVDNCLIYGFNRGGILNNTSTGGDALNADSCTVYGCGLSDFDLSGGIVAAESATMNIFNCCCVENDAGGTLPDDFRTRTGTPTWTGTDNIASDTSAESKFTTSFDSVVLIDTNPVSGENVHITSISGRDFNIVDEDAETVTQNGVDRSATHPAPQTTDGTVKVQDLATDIKDVSRTVTWSIGAFEFVAAGGPVTTRILSESFVMFDFIPGVLLSRSRSLVDSLQVIDTIQNPREQIRQVAESSEVNDEIVTTYLTKKPGDQISVAEFVFLHTAFGRIVADNFNAIDSIVIMKNLDRVISETSKITDAIVLIRESFRQLVDAISVTDSFQKTITREAGFTINEKVLIEGITITDDKNVAVSGVIVRQLLDTISFSEAIAMTQVKLLGESLSIVDSSNLIRIRNRLLTELEDPEDDATLFANSINVTDDIIVTRGSLIFNKSLSDSIVVSDDIDVDLTVPVDSSIFHGIEAL